MENKEIEIFFRTRNSCTIKVPVNLKGKQTIRDFIIYKHVFLLFIFIVIT